MDSKVGADGSAADGVEEAATAAATEDAGTLQ